MRIDFYSVARCGGAQYAALIFFYHLIIYTIWAVLGEGLWMLGCKRQVERKLCSSAVALMFVNKCFSSHFACFWMVQCKILISAYFVHSAMLDNGQFQAGSCANSWCVALTACKIGNVKVNSYFWATTQILTLICFLTSWDQIIWFDAHCIHCNLASILKYISFVFLKICLHKPERSVPLSQLQKIQVI